MRRSNAPSVRRGGFIPLFKRPETSMGVAAAPKPSETVCQAADGDLSSPARAMECEVTPQGVREGGDSLAGDERECEGKLAASDGLWTPTSAPRKGRVMDGGQLDAAAAHQQTEAPRGTTSSSSSSSCSSASVGGRPAHMSANTSDTPPTAAKRAPFLIGGRKPLHPLVGVSGLNAIAAAGSTSSPGLKKFTIGAGVVPRTPIEVNKVEHDVEYYEVFYTKSSKKKHKNWENGSVVRKGNGAELRGEDGAMITKTILKSSFTASFTEGQTLFIGSFECEVVKMVTEDEYITKGADFACNRDSPAASITPSHGKLPLPVRAGFKKVGVSVPGAVPVRQVLAPVAATARFCNDPNRIGAHCLNPNAAESEALIVVDPVVGSHLKPHQVKGVQFLFDRTMPEGVRSSDPQIQGCILADEMGLGKTVQTIALIWTLLKQSRFSAFQPSVKKAIVVVPSSLVSNWAAEFQKWLGVQRISIQVVSTGKSASGDVRDFCLGSVKDVLIVSYDLLRRHIDVLKKCSDCQLLVCDEGHRLKNIGGNATIKALNMLPAKKRILLSGTPVQNNLDEFYSMCNFVQPGCLGTPKSFKLNFSDSIVRSRDKNCSEDEARVGRKRLKELNRRTAPLVLRRTQQHIAGEMPPKTEHIVFCKPSSLQKDLYRAFLDDKAVKKTLASADAHSGGGSSLGTQVLGLITKLSKILNHPDLVMGKKEECEEEEGVPDLEGPRVDDIFPAGYKAGDAGQSGKMQFAFAVLKQAKACGDRVVVVSNYTTTLGLLETMCKGLEYPYIRLDGSTDVSKRGDLVKQFNDPRSDVMVFLLSSKAGGVGLNLIGGNRIILLDPAWNPATDLQAMARVWRFGQKKEVFIYRTLTSGTIEERVFQKQIRKGELEEIVVDEGKATKHFEKMALKDIFILRDTKCDTYDLLADTGRSRIEGVDASAGATCKCKIAGYDSFADAGEAAQSCGDACLETAAASLDGVVSFVLSKRQTSLDGSASSCAEGGEEEVAGDGGSSSSSSTGSDEEEERAGGAFVGEASDCDFDSDDHDMCVDEGDEKEGERAGNGGEETASPTRDACTRPERKRKRLQVIDSSESELDSD